MASKDASKGKDSTKATAKISKFDQEKVSAMILEKLIAQFGKPKNDKNLKNLFANAKPTDIIKNRKKIVAAANKDDEKTQMKAGTKSAMVTTTREAPNNVEYPENEQAICDIVIDAAGKDEKVRVIGSLHSPTFAVYDDTTNRIISLDKYNSYTLTMSEDGSSVSVTVDGGIILGSRTPELPTSDDDKGWDSGLIKQLDDAGYALTDLGGIVHQAVGGFTAMGCAGGTTQHDFYELIESIRIIDGTGTPIDYNRPSGDEATSIDDPFWGVIVSMGLCGIISKVTFRLDTTINKSFNVIGSQVALPLASWGSDGDNSTAAPDNVGIINFEAKDNSDENSLYQVMTSSKTKETEYMRFFWAPQSSDDQQFIQMWKAHTEDEAVDSVTQTYKDVGIYDGQGNFVGKDYEQAAPMEQLLANLYYNLLVAYGTQQDGPEAILWDKLIKRTLGIFLDIFMGKDFTTGVVEPQYFGQLWYRAIPMDTTIDDDLMPFQFTELFVDIEDTTAAVNLCKDWFELEPLEISLDRIGYFPWEFYCARKDYAWIRPNYNMDCFRIDILWFDMMTLPDADPYDFYMAFWEYLVTHGLKFRVHWGKYCPHGRDAFPELPDPVLEAWNVTNDTFDTWLDYYKWVWTVTDPNDSTKTVSLIDKFITLMTSDDDKNAIFRNNYWNEMFFAAEAVTTAKK